MLAPEMQKKFLVALGPFQPGGRASEGLESRGAGRVFHLADGPLARFVGPDHALFKKFGAHFELWFHHRQHVTVGTRVAIVGMARSPAS